MQRHSRTLVEWFARVAASASALMAAGIVVASAPAMSQALVVPGGAPTSPQSPTTPGAKDNAGPSLWSTATPLSGVVASLKDTPGGRTKRAISKRDGILSLGPLSDDTYDIDVELQNAGAVRFEKQQVLVGVYVPASKSLIGTTVQTRSLNGKIKLYVGPKGEPRSITSFDGVPYKGEWDADKFGSVEGKDVKLIFLLPASGKP